MKKVSKLRKMSWRQHCKNIGKTLVTRVYDRFLLEKVENGTFCLKTHSKFNHHKETLKMILIKQPEQIQHICEKLKKNIAFLFKCAKVNPKVYDYLTDEQRKGVILMIEPNILNYGRKIDMDDEYFAFDLVVAHPICFQFLSKTLKNDETFVLKAIESNIYVIDYISCEYRMNYEFMLKLVNQNPVLYNIANHTLKSDLLFNLECAKTRPAVVFYMKIDSKHETQLLLVAAKSVKSVNDKFMVILHYMAFKNYKFSRYQRFIKDHYHTITSIPNVSQKSFSNFTDVVVTFSK